MRSIAVTVTCYNNEAEVIEFAKALLEQSIADQIQLSVTCNACSDFEKFKDALLKVSPSVLVYNPGENLGYLNGCLYGIKKSYKQYSWVMVCNTDIQFKERDFFERLLENTAEDVWCIGPDIVLSATGVHQNPFWHDRPSRTRTMIWKVAYSNYLFFKLYDVLSKLKPKSQENMTNQQSGFVYSVHGSCFVLSNACVEQVLEECSGIFMYEEELLISEIAYKNGKRVFYHANAGIFHNENQVTGKINLKRKQKWFKNSINYIYDHFWDLRK